MAEYFKIKATPVDGDGAFLVNKLFNRLHGIFAKEGLCLGLGFPQWDEYTIGMIITVFGTKAELERVSANDGLSELVEKKLIQVDRVKDVPQDANKVVFVRDTACEWVNPAVLRRQMRQLKAECAKENRPWDEEAYLASHGKESRKDRAKLPFVTVERSKASFRFYINRLEYTGEAQATNGSFSQYGLSQEQPSPTAWVYEV